MGEWEEGEGSMGGGGRRRGECGRKGVSDER